MSPNWQYGDGSIPHAFTAPNILVADSASGSLADWAQFSIAVLAFGIAIFEAYTSRHHARLSVRQAVGQVTTISTVPPEARVVFVNCGLGPAVVKRTRIFVDDVEESEDFDGWIKSIQKLDGEKFFSTYLEPGMVTLPSQKYSILEVVPDPTEFKVKRFAEQLLRVRVRIEFESMYGEQNAYDYIGADHVETMPV